MAQIISKNDLKKISNWVWEIPKSFRRDMRVPVRLYVSEKMLNEVFKDKSIWQAINVATLPGIQRYALVMPDMHEGYSSPIGGVAAIDVKEGIISPGMQGYDINCGVRVLVSSVKATEIQPYIEKLANEINKEVPSGLGRGRQLKFSIEELDKIMEGGVPYLVEQGYGEKEDIENCEGNGRLPWANSKVVSLRAKERGRDQVGTLGSGNHFLEVQVVQEIFDEDIAEVFGLFKDQIVIMIHTGSRGLGHQICSDYLREFIPLMEKKYKINVPDREFACVPFKSNEGQRAFSASGAGANYAWANRQMITHFVRKAWKNVFGERGGKLSLLYDVAHNIIKKEMYAINGRMVELAVHRKGATRAFPPYHPEIPPKYQKSGQPVIIPGSMGTFSYILVGVMEAEEAFYSTCHGSGRTMSRHAAIRSLSGEKIIKELKERGILVKCYSMKGIAEEAPQAYKNIDEVIEVVHNAGLSRKVAKLRPLVVIKGE